jgi:hypothetical protein
MKTKLALVAFLGIFAISSCSDDEAKPKFSSSPTAKEANDASGQGIYKAVLVGSTGSIIFNMDNNGDGKISAVLKFDGKTYKLHTDDVFNENGYFEGYFYGTFEEEDDIEVYFGVTSNGSEYGCDIDFPGHSISTQMYKEYSTHVVMVFEGTYTVMGEEGTLNIIATMDEQGEGDWYGMAHINDTEVVYYLEGGIELVESVKVLGGSGSVFTVAGTVSGNTVSGSCNKGEGQGTFTAKRTL